MPVPIVVRTATNASAALLAAVNLYPDKFTPAERDKIGEIRHALAEIADGERDG